LAAVKILLSIPQEVRLGLRLSFMVDSWGMGSVNMQEMVVVQMGQNRADEMFEKSVI